MCVCLAAGVCRQGLNLCRMTARHLLQYASQVTVIDDRLTRSTLSPALESTAKQSTRLSVQTDRQIALLKDSIEAGILLGGNGVLHRDAMVVACALARSQLTRY